MKETLTARKGKESGQVLVIVALALIAVTGMLALAVDGGNMYLQRRRAQNAADAAALGATFRLADGWDDAAIQAVVIEYAVTRNGADTVEAVYLPSETTVGGGYIPGGSTGIRVHATKTARTFFAGVIGLSEATLASDAAAQFEIRSQGCGGYAIYAHSEDCSKPIDWSGSGGEIVGWGHSNGKIKVSGSGHTVTGGSFEYVTTVQETGSGHSITYVQGSVSDSYPVVFDMDRYRPGGEAALAAGGQYYVHNCSKWKVSGSGKTLAEGLHYCSGKADISGSGHYGHVTIVAEGDIDVSGSGHTFQYYCDGLLFFSNYERSGTPKCNNPTIDISGSGGSYEGICYAPNGAVEYTGSGHHVMNGSLIGWCVDISGSGFTLTYEGDICESGGSTVVVRMIQ